MIPATHIRRTMPHDAPRLVALFRDAVLAVDPTIYSRSQREEWAAALTEDALRGDLAAGRLTGYVAERNGLVGFATLEGGLLKHCFVHPSWQGRGLGGLLMRRVEALARRRGLRLLRVYASLNARPAYSSRGFVVQRLTAHRFPSGELLPTLVMAKPLR